MTEEFGPNWKKKEEWQDDTGFNCGVGVFCLIFLVICIICGVFC